MSPRRRTRGCLGRLILLALALVVVLLGALFASLALPYRGFSKEVFIDIPKGTTTSEIADTLTGSGVVRFPWQFLLTRTLRSSARLQAGEYRFHEPASVWTVFDRIVRGDVFYYEVTVPEGSNIFDIAGIVEPLGFLKGADFLMASRNPRLIGDLAPQARSLEGYLFPSTYRLTRHTTAAQLCRTMTEQFRKVWQETAHGQSIDVNQVVTLASLVEKETAVPEERPRVAGVYLNRLRDHIPLDCDPTTIYAALLENRYHGAIHRSDLDSDNEYNTYRHAGLPPGPIASPGVSSLRAALNPEQHNYIYFVAKGDGSGGHNFAVSLAEHEHNVAAYRSARNR